MYKLFFSMSFYGQVRQLFHISEPTFTKKFFKLEFLFPVLDSMVSKNICKLRHKLKNSKNLPELTWSWQNKPWYKTNLFQTTICCKKFYGSIPLISNLIDVQQMERLQHMNKHDIKPHKIYMFDIFFVTPIVQFWFFSSFFHLYTWETCQKRN